MELAEARERSLQRLRGVMEDIITKVGKKERKGEEERNVGM